jgi:hypothetical protein
MADGADSSINAVVRLEAQNGQRLGDLAMVGLEHTHDAEATRRVAKLPGREQ